VARERRAAIALAAEATADGLLEETLAIPPARLSALEGRRASIGSLRPRIEIEPVSPTLLRVRAIVAYDQGEKAATMLRTAR
jgi:hypothetical protein